MVCIEVSNIFVTFIMKLVKKFVMMLVTSLGQAFAQVSEAIQEEYESYIPEVAWSTLDQNSLP
jgi:hypothetical protein